MLEERDVQIRGHKVRLPLDVLLVASANPEDYTNRGRIITPLKDRFGARIRTHYPQDLETELTIVAQEARSLRGRERPARRSPSTCPRSSPGVSQLARRNPRVSQHSGVSVRLSVTNQETLAAAAIRRALRHGETEAAPRVSDLGALVSSTLGKLEIESLEEGEDEEVVDKLIKAAILQTFREHCPPETLGQVVGGFEDGKVVHIGPDLSSPEYVGDSRGAARAPHAGAGAHRRVGEPGGDRQRHRARAGRAASLQAAQQGRGRAPGDLPGALGRPMAIYRLLEMGRQPGRFRPRRGRRLVGDQRRPHVPRRRRLCAPPDDAAGLRGPRRPPRGRACRSFSNGSGRRRRQERDQHDPGGAYQDIANELNEILDQEREALDRLEQEPASRATSGAKRSPTRSWASAAHSSGCSPRTWPAVSRGLTSYEFTSSEASEHFEELSWSGCAKEAVQTYLDQVAGAALDSAAPPSASASAAPSMP